MTREEAIRFLNEQKEFLLKGAFWEETRMNINEAFGMAIEALEAQRWIPVSENKPEPFQEVLVTLHENGWNGATYDTVKSWAYDGDYKITAWMPLPQPYKENDRRAE